MRFFDSWGGLWTTCDGAEKGAVAFGPRGAARPVEGEELRQLLPERAGDETPYGASLRVGRLSCARESHEWDELSELAPAGEQRALRAVLMAFLGAASTTAAPTSSPLTASQRRAERREEKRAAKYAARKARRERAGGEYEVHGIDY